MMKSVQYYGCVRCQKQHFEDTDKALFDAHIMEQSKHGIRWWAESLSERAARYGIPPADSNAPSVDGVAAGVPPLAKSPEDGSDPSNSQGDDL